MTLQEAKDQVAKSKNFIDWPDLCARDHYTNLEHATDKAAELYAQSQVNESLDKAIEAATKLSYSPWGHESFPVIVSESLIEELKRLKR